MAEIAVLIPVLNRPHNVERVIESLCGASEGDVCPVFLCSPEDHEQKAACLNSAADTIIVPWPPGPGDFAKKHNLGFRHTETPFVFLAADDLEFERGWDTAVLAEAARTRAGVIGTDDDANPLVKKGRHSTHTLVSRRYIDEVGGTWHDGPGVVYHEGYDHQWVDTELVHAAMQRREWAFARQSVVRHLHPMYQKRGQPRTAMDATYEKAMAQGRADMQLFLERQRQAHPRRTHARRTL